MKKRIVVTALLLCVAFVMASMAYSVATVTNVAKLKIVKTGDALLALSPGSGKDGTAYLTTDEKRLEFNFNKGRDNKFFGLQPWSTYQWNHLFTVTNNSNETISVTLSASDNLKEYLWYAVYTGNFSNNVTWRSASSVNTLGFDINGGPGGGGGDQDQATQYKVAVKLVIPQNANLSYNDILGTIVVTGTAN